MALTTTQVNQAFLATLGRPAEGSAATWGSTSLSLDTLLDSIFIAENTDGDFVEYLYQNILGRASDAEGKAFWNSLLATTSKEAVLAQFKAAVIAAGQADPANADYQSFIAQNKAFVTELYTNLLGRTDAASADAEGVEFWANALASGTSKGALLAQFTAAALSDPNSDDAQTLNAKVNVANAITAKFNNFNADVTADQKKAALDALKATMTEVVAGSTTEDFQERIDTFAGNYQNRVAQVFTTKDDDQLDASEATASTVFSGNVNLIDPAKGTIQTTDSVAGNSNYTDTLRVSVTSDSANKDFSLTSNLPTSVSSIEKLIITAGAANVSGNLDGNNYAESTTITSTGDVDLKIVGGVQKELKVTAGDKKDATITVNSGSLDNYTGSAAKDTIIVNAGNVKTIDTGAGKDTVEIKGTGSIQSEGSIKLGAGDDELTIGVALGKETLNKISLDGGEGSKDKLTISTDITAVNSITGFETIDATTGTAKISADAANSLTSGTKLANLSSLTIDMDGKNSLNLKNLKVGNGTDNKLGTANVAISNVAKGEVTLTTTTNNAIVETITLKETATNGTTGPVTIKGIGAAKVDASGDKVATSNGDKLKIDGINLTGTPTKIENFKTLPDTLASNNLYYINTAISSADDLASKGTVYGFVGNNTTLASGQKALVALNNSAQNKSYVFEISGTGTKVTRDDITLKAIVDNAINKKDVITAGNEIEFVAGTEPKDVKPAGGDTGVTVAYSALSGGESDKTFTDGETISGKTYNIDSTGVTIQSVNGKLTVNAKNGKSDYAATDKLTIEASGATAALDVKDQLANATVTLKLANNGALSEKSTTSLSNVDIIQLNGTNALALDQVSGATIKIGTTTSTDKATVDTNKGVVTLANITKAGTNAVEVALNNVENNITLSAAGNLKETLKLSADIANKTVTTFTTAEDKVDISALADKVKSVTAESSLTTVTGTSNSLASGKVYYTTSEVSNVASVATIFGANASSYATAGKDIIISNYSGSTKIYLLTTDSTAGLATTGGNNDSITLLATIAGAVDTDFTFGA